ncbi:amidase signature domain-containing protein [Aspergillus multicolor]|uniref:amidase signature domain-containing protein n=1 Tax=Aspergillus multicolor TaxID=41759 RepID=UPI003CCD2B94
MGSSAASMELPLPLRITTLHDLYASKKLTPTHLINQIYDRIESYPDKAVWIHLVPREEALAAATALTERYTNTNPTTPLPPLYGIPFSVKDSIDVAGQPTTLACPSFAYTPTATAPVVQRALDAGGILLGKTNLDQFATGLVGHRSAYGTPRCIFDGEYISGGSSSGSAVSVGAGFVAFAIATDTAGSTRVPAALNGLVGVKPTLGTLSTVGLIPACRTADCVTVLANCVGDARVAWGVMRGFDAGDVFARRDGEIPVRRPFGDVVRVGFPPRERLGVLSAPYRALFERCVGALCRLERAPAVGAHAQPQPQSQSHAQFQKANFDYAPFQAANEMLYGSSIVAQRLAAFEGYIQAHGLDKLHPAVKTIFAASSGFDAVRAYKDIFDLALYKRQAETEFLENIDILVVPSTVTHFTVAEIDEDPIGRNRVLGSFTHFVNLLDLCAVAVPVGRWENARGNLLPFGITLIGQAGRDEELMALGEKIMDCVSPYLEVYTGVGDRA